MRSADRRDRAAAQGLGWQLRWGLVVLAGLVPLALLALLASRVLVRAYVISSGSMMPALQPGDDVLFNMTAYGLRAPLVDARLSPLLPPRRGDVAVMDWARGRRDRQRPVSATWRW